MFTFSEHSEPDVHHSSATASETAGSISVSFLCYKSLDITLCILAHKEKLNLPYR